MVIKPENPEELERLLKSKDLILYGMGRNGGLFAKWCDAHNIKYLLSDRKVCSEASSKAIIPPKNIAQEYPNANVVITSIIFQNEIVNDLLHFGIKKEQIIEPSVFIPKSTNWEDLEKDNNSDWELMRKRIQIIVGWGWIPNNLKSCADYGAGHKFIETLLPSKTAYYPIDCIDRGDNTIICDFNKREFPEVHSELSVCNGVLMYIKPAEELIDHICNHTDKWIIFGYYTLEGMSDIETRRAEGICQDYTKQQIIDLFFQRNFILKDIQYETVNSIVNTYFLFEK